MPMLREYVYVLGDGPRARMVVQLLRHRVEAGFEVVGWTGDTSGHEFSQRASEDLRALAVLARHHPSHRSHGRTARNMPIPDLLSLRLAGVRIEHASTILERMTGTLPLVSLSPSALIYSDGFKIKAPQQLFRRAISVIAAATALLVCLPFLPFIALAVRLSSPGPVFFKQVRVGRGGRMFTALKFRTMCQDAEANGAVWAKQNDPRVTNIGKFMRKTRLDEIPQLWNVLRGDMSFVGPRPERPEFVQWLSKEIPFYDLRHMIRPGLTGWAQVRYKYGASLEDTRLKLEYDLYYLKHVSVGLDLLIMFETIKTIVLRRGAQ